MIVCGGLRVDVGATEVLSAEERDLLTQLDCDTPLYDRILRIEVTHDANTARHAPPEPTPHHPVKFTEQGSGGAFTLESPSFVAHIDPSASVARVRHGGSSSVPLLLTIRASLMAMLPAVGGLVLHSAGIVIDGRALVFVGRSGAGKTTLSRTSPYPILSDELVSVAVDDRVQPVAVATGFWGHLAARRPITGAYPVAAIVLLEKRPEFILSAMTAASALSELVPGAQVAPGKELWQRTLALISRLVDTIPVFRMGWSPSQPPWPMLEEALF